MDNETEITETSEEAVSTEPILTQAEVIEPTAELLRELEDMQQTFLFDEAKKARQSAYQRESDPIAFKVLRGEATTEEYIAVVESIKTRFPYPDSQ